MQGTKALVLRQPFATSDSVGTTVNPGNPFRRQPTLTPEIALF